MALPLRLGALLVVLAATLAAGCTNDCDVICEKQVGCLGDGDPAAVELCRDQCLRDMEADGSADELDACATCLEGESCDALYPADDALGVCGKECN